MRSFLYLFLICISVFPAQSGQSSDSLRALLTRSTADEKALVLLELSRDHLNDSAGLVYVEEAFKTAQTDSVKGRALYFKSFIHKSQGLFALQSRELKEALELLGEDDPWIRYSAMGQLTRSLSAQGFYAEALEVALERLALSETLPDRENVVEALLEVGYVYDRMGEYVKAIAWYQRAMPIVEELDNDFLRGDIYGRTGIAYDELGEYTTALENNFKAVEYFEKAGYDSHARTWYSNIGNTYTKTGQLQNAERYTLLALSDPTEHWRVVTLVNLGKIYLEQKRFAEAQKTLDSALEASQARGSKRVLSEAYYRLHELRRKQSKFQEALVFFEKHKATEDDMLNEAKARQISELTVRYETYEKEMELLGQKAVLAQQELELHDKNAMIAGVTALVFVSLIFGFFIYRQQKLRNMQLQKEAELAEARSQIASQRILNEQRLHISRELHDNIGTYLTLMRTGLERLPESAESHRVEEVAQLMKKTAVELRHTVWILNSETTTLEEIIVRVRELLQFSTLEVGISADVIGDDQLTLRNIQSTHLIRVIQEAVNNTLKHAEASQIDILIISKDDCVGFEVRDNGIGFKSSACKNGNGIRNMRYRMERLGGSLCVESSEPKGTKVSGEFPVSDVSLVSTLKG